METAKIRVKVGSIELEYEGAPEFLGDGLNQLLEHVATISRAVPAEDSQGHAPSSPENTATEPANESPQLQLSTASIAARLGVKSGPELAIAAMAHLEMVKHLQSYSRKEILDEMKTASAYYKKNMSGNHSANVSNLVKSGRVNEVGSGKFCLSATERSKIEAALADAQ